MHTLADVEQNLTVLDGHPTKFPPDDRFSYRNGGFALLALLAERASGTRFHRLVRERVVEPAGLTDTGYFRSDELPRPHRPRLSPQRRRRPDRPHTA